jgi:hypothetical protein
VQASEATLDRLPKGMRQAVEEVLKPGEELLAIWNTRGYGANALVCAADRALIAKRPALVRWSVGVYPYTEIESVEMLDSRPGATQVELNPRGGDAADKPPIFAEFPDAYYQESRRLVASNTVMFRSRRRAREAVAFLESVIAERGRR